MQKPRMRKNESIDEYNERASKTYYTNGYHIKEIANRLKIDEVEVYNYVITKGHKITTEDERRRMINLFNQGYSYSAIARIMGKIRAYVRDRIERPAKINNSGSGNLTDKQIKKIKDMANEGACLCTIAEEMNIPISAVRYRLSHGIREVHHTHLSKAEKQKIIRLHKNGKSTTEIANICSRSWSTVRRCLRRVGLLENKK